MVIHTGSRFYFCDGGIDQESEVHAVNLEQAFVKLLSFALDGIVITKPSEDHLTCLRYLIQCEHMQVPHSKLIVDSSVDLDNLLPHFHSDKITESLLSKLGYSVTSMYMKDVLFNESSFHFWYGKLYPLELYEIQPRRNSIVKNTCSQRVCAGCKELCLQVCLSNVTDSPLLFLTGCSSARLTFDVINNLDIISVLQIPHNDDKCYLPQQLLACIPSDDEIRNMALLLALVNRQNSFVPVIENLNEKHSLKKSAVAFKFYLLKKASDIEESSRKMISQPCKANRAALFSLDNNAQILWYNRHKDLFPSEVRNAVESENEKQLKSLEYLRKCLKWAYFYQNVKADLYIASNRPTTSFHEVLNGIIIANVWRKSRCRIALPNNANLHDVSLNIVFPKVIRDIACEQTEIWFLNEYVSNSLPNHPPFSGHLFTHFTVKFCQQTSEGNTSNPSMIVNPFNHSVTVTGMKSLNLNGIISVSDIQKDTDSVFAYGHKVISHISKSRPPSKIKTLSVVYLEKYLKLIGYPNPQEPCRLTSVLECLLGCSIVSQLYCLQGSEDSDYLSVMPSLLSLTIRGSSKFHLNQTEMAAKSADIEIYLPSNKSAVKVVGEKLSAAVLKIRDPKTPSVKVTLKLEFTNKTSVSLEISKYLKLEGSCGATVAQFLLRHLSSGQSYTHAELIGKLKTGELLHILLGEVGALKVLKRIPFFLSKLIASSLVNNYLTTIKWDSGNHLEEAHIYINKVTAPPTSFSDESKLTCELLVVHMYPSHKEDDQAVEIEGTLKLNEKHCIKLRTTSTSEDVKLTFTDSVTVSDVFNLLCISNCCNSSTLSLERLDILKEGVQYEAGFTLSHTLPSTTKVSLSSIFFAIDCDNVLRLLPASLSSLISSDAMIKAFASIRYPCRACPRVSLEAQFVLKLNTHSKVVHIDCVFEIYPFDMEKSGHVYSLTIRPYYRPYLFQECIEGVYVCDNIISLLSTEINGKSLKNKLDDIPEIGHQIVNSVIVTKGTLHLLNGSIINVMLDAFIPCLKLMSGKVVLHDCDITLIYSDKNMNLGCKAKLTLLHYFNYNIEMTLPTSENEGKIYLENFNENVTLKAILTEFGWLSQAVLSYPILSSMFDISIRKLKLVFGPCLVTADMQVLETEIVVHKKEFDIGILTFSDIDLTVMIKRVESRYRICFFLQAFIANSLYAELEYNPDDHFLTGRIIVPCFCEVTALDAIQAFHVDQTGPSEDGLRQLGSELQKHFLDVLKSSDNQQKAGCGLTAFIDVKIRTPAAAALNHPNHYSLEYVCLELRDALKIRNCILDTLQFEYSKFPFPESADSTVRLVAVIRVLESSESMIMKFDLTSKEGNKTYITAVVEKSTKGMKVCSILELCGCDTPKLPNVGLPPIFDLELVGGSISFTLRPFQVCSFNVEMIIPDWHIFNDPELEVQNLKMQVTWTSGSSPELTFTDSFLTFRSWFLLVSGRISVQGLYINCKNPSSKESEGVLQFESLLREYSPSSVCPCPEIPTDLGLPSMVVKSIELDVRLEEQKKSYFRLGASVAPSSTWTIDFGIPDQQFTVTEIGGALEWAKSCGDTSKYKAILYGKMKFYDTNISVEMTLGTCDSILIAEVSNLHYGQIADYLVYQEKVSQESSTLTTLVPRNVKEIAPISSTMAINITRRSFIFSGSVEEWGHCFLYVDLKETDELKYVVVLTLKERFHFSMLSEKLAFIDNHIAVHSLNVVVSSVELQQLNDVLKPFNCGCLNNLCEKPFSSLSNIFENEFARESVGYGTTLYAIIDIHTCKQSNNAINYVFELGDEGLANHDIIVKIFVPANDSTEFELYAHLSTLNVCGVLVFSDVKLTYKFCRKNTCGTSSAYKLKLTGVITFHIDLNATERCISFTGDLCIIDGLATFITKSRCKDVVHQPAGMDITFGNLKLKLEMDLRKGRQRLTNTCISGDVRFGVVCLQAKLLFEGVTFRVFHVQLSEQLKLSFLLEHICNGWSASSLTAIIKEGHFYYARQGIEFTENGKLWKYEAGYHIECVINLFTSDFRIKADISHDRSELSISGRSVEKIDFGFAKLTGTGQYRNEGPELRYASRTLSLRAGIEIFNDPWFEGELSYSFSDCSFTGTIAYLGRILWIKNPKIVVQWSKEKGFKIVHFPILDDFLGFNLLGAIGRFARVLYNLVGGLLKWGFKLSVTTGENPDPSRYLLKLILQGSISVTVLGFIHCDLIPLPDIPLRIPKVDNFSIGKLPELILKCLWESAGDICKSILKFINPFELAKKMGKRILDAITGAIESVVNVVKKVVKKAWGWCKRLFGFSAFILDADTNIVLGYIFAGKEGRELCDIEYIVNHFGSYLAVHALGEVAGDVHKNASACINADKSTEEHEQIHDKLDELKEQTHTLNSNLNLAADDILTVRNIKTEIINNQIRVEWEACNKSGEVVFNDDKGDIEHHLTIIVTTLDIDSRDTLKTKQVYDGCWTAQSENEHKNELSEENEAESTPDSTQEKKSQMQKGNESQTTHEKLTKIESDIKVKTKEERGRQQSQEQAVGELQRTEKINEVVTSELTVESNQGEKAVNKFDRESQEQLQGQELHSNRELVEELTAEKCHEDEVENEINKEMLEQENLQNKCPAITISVDDWILEHAIKLTVSLQPTVTLRVMTPNPDPNNPIIVGQNVLDSEDKMWMTQIKEDIKKTGREKEVTLYGRKVSEKFSTELPLHAEVKIDNVYCHFSQTGKAVTIYGMMQPVSGVNRCLIQVVDSCDFTVIVKEILIPYELEQGFRIKLTDKHLPQFSNGPYIIHVMAIGPDCCTSPCITVPNLEIHRHIPPTDLNLSLIDSDCKNRVKISWRFSEDSDFVPIFKIVMLVTSTEELAKKSVYNTDQAIQPVKECCIPDSFVTTCSDFYECKFTLEDLFHLFKIPLKSGVLLKFLVSTHGPSKLPSKPKAVDFILVAPPRSVTVSYPEKQPGIQLSWKRTTHTVSYLVEAINKDAQADGTILSKQFNHDKSMKSAIDMDVLVNKNDLMCLKSGCCYKLQVSSLGFGADLHQSLVPCIAIEKLLVIGVQIEFLPNMDTIIVRFEPCFGIASYTIELYKILDDQKPYLFQSESVKNKIKHTVVKKFQGYKKCWGVALGPECSVIAWVRSSLSDSMQIGISTNKLQVLKSPSDISVIQKQESDLSIKEVTFTWSEVTEAQVFQYGLYNANTGKVLFQKRTIENSAAIMFSEIDFQHLSYVCVECFVRSEGNAMTLTSDPILATTVYQCIVAATSKVIVYTSTLLHRMWSRHLATLSFRYHWLNPTYKYLLFPGGVHFPDLSLNPRIWEKFWEPELPCTEG